MRSFDGRGGETADLLALRGGVISSAEYERRNGITNVNDPRHAAWYAEHRAQVEVEIRAQNASGYRPANAVPEADSYDAWEQDVMTRGIEMLDRVYSEDGDLL